MEVKFTWRGGLGFDAKTESGHTVAMDGAPVHGGKESGPRPMEMILVGLGSCTAMDVISILKKMKCQVDRLDVTVQAQQADQHPKVFTHYTIEYIISGSNIEGEQVKRAIELSQEKYCSVSAMLRESAPIEYSWKIEK